MTKSAEVLGVVGRKSKIKKSERGVTGWAEAQPEESLLYKYRMGGWEPSPHEMYRRRGGSTTKGKDFNNRMEKAVIGIRNSKAQKETNWVDRALGQNRHHFPSQSASNTGVKEFA